MIAVAVVIGVLSLVNVGAARFGRDQSAVTPEGTSLRLPGCFRSQQWRQP